MLVPGPTSARAPRTGRLPRRFGPLALTLALPFLGAVAPVASSGETAPGAVLVVLGGARDGRRLEAAAEGVRLGAKRPGQGEVRIEALDDEGTPAGLQAALRTAKRLKPTGVVAVPTPALADAYWKATRSLKAPWFFVAGRGPDRTRNRGNVWHLAPSVAAEAVAAADSLIAPLGARRVGVVHEPTERGRALAAAFARNLSRHVVLAGVHEWPAEATEEDVGSLTAFEADWIFAAVGGRHAVSLVRSLAAAGRPQHYLFSDGNRDESLLALGREVLEGSVFLDGPDPEMQGRMGEAVVEGLEDAGAPVDTVAVRAFEAARRILDAQARADSTKVAKVRAALEAGDETAGAMGTLRYEPHRGIRFFPFTLWVVKTGRFDPWPEGLLPCLGCGPPLGFGRPPPASINEKRGRIGYLTYGEGEKRTIEQDLLELGLSTNGEDPEMDRIVRDEILGRAIRIAHQLFRREADGTPIPGWSWGMTFTTEEPSDDLPRSRIWLGIVAGDHPAAGGQVIGSGMVAVYSTFLKRTMYVHRKLDPPLSKADRPLFDGGYRWGEDRTWNFRADKVRCLIDGLASAMGLTLAHEFGHLCGCGHDTEHPTSIMNVVAGAGAEWADAVWIPSHQKSVTTALGIEGR